jgi:hypothetical protein
MSAPAAERPLTHELFDDDMPVSAAKEQLSISLIHMLSSAAGLDLGNWTTDYNAFDVTVKSNHDYSPYLAGPKLDIQLKCTGQERAQRANHLAWSLSARTCKLLSAKNRSTMALFCVATVPELPGHWISWPNEGLLAHTKAYFLRGQDIPEVPDGQESLTLHIPYENLLTPTSLQDLMAQAAQWRLS